MKTVIEMALEALMRSRKAVSGDLDLAGCAYGNNDPDGHRYDDAKKALVTLEKAITALREALAQERSSDEQPIIKSYLEKDNSLQPLVVPDALTAHDHETPEYKAGWNDCRQLMMEMLKESNT
jgi:hypothetical protein